MDNLCPNFSTQKKSKTPFFKQLQAKNTFLFLLTASFLFGSISSSVAQTTWSEDAAGYNLDLGGNKDGGFAFCDFDLDGDFDLLVNRNDRSFLYENDGGTSFNDITASQAPELSNSARERCAVWGDLNNDGYPDFARNTSSRGIEVYLQHPATGRFGDGTGGFTPQEYNGSNSGSFNIANGVNTEGMGFLDYDGDGYLDIVFDNHNYGVDMLQNDGTGFFSHVTAKGPSYNAGNPSTWPLGLAQDAVDGDYGSVTDYDNDGWVDFIARKRNQVDFFRNIGGTFDEAVDVGQAQNGNKGAVNFSDFDNDGDFDLFWTENDDNQIFENQNGNFVALGNATGIPTGFGGNRIDGLACGDVDNDGDIDIFLAGDQEGILYINQINDPIGGANTGSAMVFVESGESFYNDDGEGASFVDIDNDGDLDLYVNIRNDENVLFINQLSGAPLDNYLFVDIKENRAIANMPAGVERDALGATLRLVDCEGNVISGIREINGGNGHGTQDIARIHFGLPDGPADYYILQASYPNIAGQPRLQINEEIRPVDYAYHLYEINYDAALNNPPAGQDDILYYTENTPFNFDPLLDHGNGVDSDPDGDDIYVYAIGTAPSNGTATVNGNGTITYTPNTDFIGIDTFTYILADNTTCAAAGLFDEVTVELIYSGSPDNCVEGFDPYSWNELPPNDDGSTPQLNIPFDFELYGTTYNSLYINNNGNVSFDNPYSWYTSAGFPIGTPMIAPFWGDVDTRDWGPYGYQGEVWYTINSNSVYVTWMNVGPYNAYSAVNDDLQNTFTLVMSDGTDPILAPGNNIGFFYGDMQWTTGSASGGTDGFGGSPATVGVNAGNGVDYVLLGMYNTDDTAYDGPGGNNDGVNWLDDGCFEWNVSSSENFPPVAQGFPQGNSINICFGATETLNLGFSGPETDETVNLSVNTNGWSGANLISSSNGNPASAELEITGDAVGTYTVSFSATDDDVEPETTNIDLIVNVLDCTCSAPPTITCAADINTGTDLNSCDANVNVTSPSVVSTCFGTTAVDFDGNNDYIQIPNRINDGAFAFDFWFKPPSSNWSGTLFDMSEDDPANGTNQRYFYIHGDENGLEFSFESDDDTDMNLNANVDLSTVRWYHVVVNGNFNAAGPHQIYVDGSVEASSNTAMSAKPTTYRAPRIGNYGSSYGVPQESFGGQIDNFRIFDTNLSLAEVNEVACSNLSSVPNNLIMNLQFEDGTGSAVASDSSPNGNDGALNNMNVNTVWVNSDLISECITLTNNITGTEDASGTYPAGSTNVIWTATNTSGNSSTCTQIITVTDDQDPNITCPTNLNVSNTPGICGANLSLTNPIVSDNCGSVNISNNAPATFPIGSTNVVWTATDAEGNTSTCTQTVVVSDNEDPNAVCQDLVVQLNASGNASITSAMVDDGSTDNCGISSIALSQTSFDCSDLSSGASVSSSNGYNVNIDVNAVNIIPSSNSCAFGYNYTVELDYEITFEGANIPANLWTLQGTIGCGPNTHFFSLPNSGGSGTVISANAYSNTSDCATVTPESLGCNTINIQISGPGISNQTIALNPSTVPVIMTVEDNNGNTSTCTSMVSVEDNIAPSITCGGTVNTSTDAGLCTSSVALSAPITNDNCGVASVSNNAPANFPIGTTTVVWTVSDASGNTNTCSQDVVVTDNENPIITCSGDITVNTNAPGCRANVTVPVPSTSDNCGLGVLSNDFNGTANASGNYPVGTTTVVWTILDNNGNAATCSQNITVVDNLSVNVGGNITVCEGEEVTLNATATGSGPFNYTWDNGLGNGQSHSFTSTLATYQNNTTTYTVNVSDANGCTATETVNVTVLSVPQANVSVSDANCGLNNGNITFSYNNHPGRGFIAFSLDGGTSYENGVNDNTGSVSYNGLAPGTYTLFARWGNNECPVELGTFTINDIDNTDPTIVCPSDMTVSTSAASCNANVTVIVPFTNDNCSISSLVNDFNGTNNASGIYPLGVTTVVWTVTDYNGNTATCSMDVTVVDDVAPVITCASDLNTSTDADDCFATVTLTAPATTDNCGVASVNNDAPATFPIGTTTVTWTVTDNAGNTSTCTQDVTVTDNEDPTITCAADVNTTTDADDCFATVTLTAPATADNCGVASVNNDAPATFPIGTTTVTWTVTDNAGNNATCTQDVTVTDNENPTITCAADVITTTDADDCFATVTLTAPATADNCGVASVNNDAPATFPIGTTTVTWTVTDNAGNTATCTQDVTVSDNEDPTITCAADVNTTTDADDCFATVSLTAPATADNCGVASVNNNAPATFPIGTTTVTWTVTDNAGNTATCTQDVTVGDNEDPTITCAADVNTTTDADDCFATVILVAPATADNCGVASVNNDAPATFPIGTTTVTWTVSDNAGNTATCAQDVTVTDNQDPTIVCPANVSQGADAGESFATVNIAVPASADNCGVASVINDFNGTNDASGQYPLGSTTVTWTVTDVNGNTTTCVQIVNISDDQAPTITCPADQTEDLSASCNFTLPDYTSLASATDNSDPVLTIVQSPAAGTIITANTIITMSVTDSAGNVSTCTFEVILEDNTDPTITCAADVNTTTDADDCFATVSLTTPATADNCGVASVNNNAPATFPIGTTTVTWTVTDNAGNTATCTQDVTVTDNENPTITCAADVNTTTDADDCFATVTLTAPATADNCGVASVNNDAPATFPIGTTTVTWTVSDNAGNTATCTQDVTVSDNEDPTITCAADVNTTTDADDCFATVTLTAPTTNDNCGVASVNNDAPATFPIGTTTVTWTVTDNAGNTAACTQDVTVSDNEDPTITCAADVNTTTDADDCFATVILVAPATADNCGVASVNNDAPATFPIGTTTVTWTVSDNAGNTATCAQDVTVTDNQDPTIVCPANVSQGADAGESFATVNIAVPASADNCGVASVINDFNGTNDASGQYPLGSTTVTWTVTDVNGNTTTCVQIVNISDDQAPTITCPADQTEDLSASCNFTLPDYTSLASATDNSDPVLTIVQSPAAGTIITANTIITMSVTDSAGNVSTCTFEVILEDNTDPTITCAADVNTTTDADDCFATVSLTTPATADNCGVASVNNNAPATFPIGTTTVTWTVTDNAGNTATCTQDVTVTDNENPTITCAADVNTTTDADDCFATVTLTAPATADNCGVASVNNDAPATFPIGTTTVTWTVSDNAGNTATCTQDVTVSDNEDPTITCAADVNTTTDADDCFATVTLTAPTTNDNCGVASVNNDAPATFPIGTTTVTWTVTDNAGNTATCTQDVTVTDNEDPTITCAADVNTTTDADDCFATVILAAPATADNCGVASVNNNAPATFPIGTTTVTWTVTDNAGNTATCTQDVTVTDNEDPTITCAADVNTTTDADDCFATVTLTAPATTDNCGVASVNNDAPATFPIGTTTVTWTVTDNAGNTATCTQDVTVTDNEDPTITCAADVNTTTDADDCFATVILAAPVTADNCGVASVNNDAPATFPIGTTTVTWTVTDNAGNTATCTQDVTVTDDEDPTIICAADVNTTTDADDCFATVTLTAPATTDNCGVASVNNDAPATFPIGTTTVTWTVTDNAGNTATCTQDVTVTDNEDPTIICPDDIVQGADDGESFATISIAVPATADNCGVASVINDFTGTADASAQYPLGLTTVTWTVTDNYGNTTTCEQIINVSDDQAPEITCPADQIEDLSASCDFTLPDYTALASATDNSDPVLTIVQSPAAGTIITTNTIITMSVTDSAGNVSTCTFEVILEDNTDPTITCAADLNINTDLGSCFATIVLTNPTTADNCGVASVTNNAPATFPIGTTTVTWIVTDNAGNTATCAQEVTVADNESPSITCTSNINVSNDNGNCEAIISVPALIASDNCGIASITNNYNGTDDASGAYPVGVTTVIWTVTDNAGNATTCDFTVTVNDDEAPVVTCIGDQTASADASCNFTMTDYTALIAATDNCDNNLDIVQVPAPGTVVSGTTAVDINITDDAGNTTTCTFNVIVEDNTNPVITVCATDQTVFVDDNCEIALADYTSLVSATDNCDLDIELTQVPAPGAIFSGHNTNIPVSIFATDDNGNQVQCDFNVNILDNTLPTITCPANLTQSADLGVCQANITIPAPVVADNCGIDTVINDYNGTDDASDVYPLGTTTVTFTVTDIAGNITTCDFTVTVNDDEAPVVTCIGDQTASADAGCNFTMTDYTALIAATDNCDNNLDIVQVPAPGTVVSGTTAVDINITDDAGNTTTCTFNVIVEDNTNPVITVCATDQTVFVDDNCEIVLADYTSLVSATDNCDLDIELTQVPAPGAIFSGHNTNIPVSIFATDDNGNQVQCDFNVNILDNTLPTITCPANLTQSADLGVCQANITIPAPVVADNCGIDTVINDYNGTDDASDVYPVGTTTVTFTVTDIAGNITTCDFTVTVNDDEAPVVTCIGDQTASADAGCNFTMTDYTALIAATDNCDNNLDIVQVPAPGTVVSGTTAVDINITDDAGNTTTCTFNVIVEDNTNPVITVCATDQTVFVDDNCEIALADYTSLVSATDNCDLDIELTQVPAPGAIFSGHNTNIPVSIFATDDNGNQVQCDFNVNILDNTLPTITCPANLTQSADLGVCQANITIPAPVVADNCGIDTVINDYNGTDDASDVYPVGTTTVTFTVTDIAGNITTCDFTVTVNDDEAPVVTCIGDQTASADAGCNFTMTDYTALIAATDNCDNNLDIVQVPAPGTVVSGTTAVDINITDDAGNTTTCTFNVIVEDNTNPVITVCATDQTVFVDDNCEIALADYTSLVSATDNCDLDIELTQVPAPGAIFSGHNTNIPVSIFATDDNGNQVQCDFNVNILDNTLPTITCPANLTQSADLGVCQANITIPAPVVADNCGIDTVINDYNGTDDASDVYPVGTTTVTFTVTDIAGNITTCDFTVTVNDDEAPSIACNADINQTADASVCEALVSVAAPVTGDNCGVASVINNYNGTADASDIYPVGTTTVTWTVTDVAGNTTTCDFNITITDDEAPSILCPANINQTADASVCEAMVSVAAPVTGDNCGVASVINNYNGTADASDIYPVGTTTVTWTVTDVAGNTTTCDFDITITDDEAPSIVCPANINQTADASVCEALVSVAAPVTGDNCAVASVINNYNGTADASDVYPVGTTTVTWTVTDVAGNTTTCDFDITITDDEAPVVTCIGDQTVSADAACNFTMTDYTALIAATDNCDNNLDVVQVPAPGTVVSGTTAVDINITDDAGNTTTCTFDVIVEDNTDPVITVCAPDQTVFVDDNCEIVLADYTSLVSATDNCDLDIELSQVPAPGAIFSGHNTNIPVSIFATDDNGNQVQCDFNVNILDNTLPTITCPANLTQSADLGVCQANITIPAPVVADNCGIDTVINDYNGTDDASDVYPVGTTTVTFTVTDIAGNITTCDFTVTVNDNEAPSIACTPDINQTADASVCEALVSVAAPVTGDNCGVASVINNYNGTADASDIYPVGTTTVTWTVTDVAGNTTTCDFNITITDDEAPSIVCPANINQTADASVCEAMVSVAAPVTGDNCGVASVINNYNGTADASDIYPVGTTTVTWTVTDVAGNTTTCDFNITITDDEAPSIVCPTNINQTADASVCEALVSVAAPVTGDNCAVASVINNYNGTADASDVYPVGTTTVTWTVTDVAGNTTTCDFDITITDDEAPSIDCPANITVPSSDVDCNAAVSVAAPTTGDNCAVASIVNDYNNTADASDVYPVGETIVTWTVTDIHGNSSNCSMSILVEDTDLPSIVCPADISLGSDLGECGALVSVAIPVSEDNCAVASVLNDYNGTADASDFYPVGITTVVWTVTDLAGNFTTCSMNIEVNDVEAPSIECTENMVQTTDLGMCSAQVTVPALIATDNCNIASIVNDYNGTDDASDVYNEGSTIVTWTVTDLAGNVSTCSFEIVINDEEAPIIECTETIEQTADAGMCDAIVSVPALVNSDNCGILSVSNDYNGTSDASDTYPVGTTSVNWLVTDIHGNTTTCSFEVIISDDEAPAVTCQNDTEEYIDSNCEFILPDYTVNAITSDNCDLAPVLTQSPLAGTIISGANHIEVITITSTDIYGNASSCDFNVTLLDTIAPSITCIEDQVSYANELCEFSLLDYTGLTLSDDNCTAPVITQSPLPGTTFSLGDVEVTMTSTDADGNATSCTFTVSILDNTPPSILCPGDQVEALTDACEFELIDYRSMMTTGDNCSDVTIEQVPAPGTIITNNTTIQMIVTDDYNNISTCNFEVILEDYIVPEITCINNISSTTDLGVCGAVIDYDLPETYDNCTVASLTLIEGLDSGSVFPVGTTVVTYEVADAFGNTAQCSFEVSISDDEAPSITCPEDITADSDLGVCGALVNYTMPVVEDNCGIASIVMLEGLDSGSTFPVGTTLITYEAIDLHGNSSVCSFNVTVLDVEAPTVLSCNSTIVVPNDLDQCGAVVTYNTPEASDNCEVASTTMISGFASGEQFPVGTTTVTYSFVDLAGNETLCSFDVIVEDTQVPNIACQDDITVFNDFGICGASVIYNLPIISDNCAVDSLVMTEGMESGSVFEVGTTTLAFEVTDIHGNQNNCSFTITVIDAEDPVIVCPEDISQEDAYVEYELPVFSDNCGANIELVEGLESGSVFPHGYTTVTYVATDEAGNTSECSFEVLINTPPVGVDDEADHFEEDEEIIIDVLNNDFDLDGDDIFISDVSSDNAEVFIENGMLVYEPLGEWCGTDTVTYVVCDPFMACDTAQVIVQVECFIDLIIPEGFSPNADGVNDTFEILGLEDYPGNVLTIFNRWGHKVFEAEEYQSDWDGTSQSMLTLGSSYLPEGTYFYVLELGNVPIKPVKGYVYLNH